MPFTITPNVAQYGGADWSNFIKTVPNCTPQSAQRIARADPNIGLFFYCRGLLVLDGHPQFNPGDAVFFSGAPWEAPRKPTSTRRTCSPWPMSA